RTNGPHGVAQSSRGDDPGVDAERGNLINQRTGLKKTHQRLKPAPVLKLQDVEKHGLRATAFADRRHVQHAALSAVHQALRTSRPPEASSIVATANAPLIQAPAVTARDRNAIRT